MNKETFSNAKKIEEAILEVEYQADKLLEILESLLSRKDGNQFGHFLDLIGKLIDEINERESKIIDELEAEFQKI